MRANHRTSGSCNVDPSSEKSLDELRDCVSRANRLAAGVRDPQTVSTLKNYAQRLEAQIRRMEQPPELTPVSDTAASSEESDLALLRSMLQFDHPPDGQQLRRSVGEHGFRRLIEEHWIDLAEGRGKAGYALTENGRNALRCLDYLAGR